MNRLNTPEAILWRLLTRSSERIKWWFSNSPSRLHEALVEFDPNHPILKMEVRDLSALSEKVDRLLLECVQFGRPPASFFEIVLEQREIARLEEETEGNMSKRDFAEALWLAISDSTFREACFGDARKTLRLYGFDLNEDELGKFRWFDYEKLSTFDQKISEIISQHPIEGQNELSFAPEYADPLELAIREVYKQHCSEVNAIRRTGVRVSEGDSSFSPGEFDPGPPVPDYATFTSLLQLSRVWTTDANRILLDSGYSFGRLLMLTKTLVRHQVELPVWEHELVNRRDQCEEWFIQATKVNRPNINERYHQSPCDPRSVLDRVEHIVRTNWLRNRKVLVLGDDDCISIALARFTEAEVHVIDIDPRMIDYINSVASQVEVEVTAHLHDLRNPLPRELVGKFWLVSADPPQNGPGDMFFFERAVESLQDQLGLRIYCSTTPLWMGNETYFSILNNAARHGFCLREILKSQMCFNIRHPFETHSDHNPAERILSKALEDTVNMACDVHVLQRMSFV